MQLIFTSNESTEMSFKVDIAGTQSIPIILVVLEKNGKSLSFNATKNGDEWIAHIHNPGAVFGVGEVKFYVNVLISGRLFTPIKASASIIETAPAKMVSLLKSMEPLQVETSISIKEVQPEQIFFNLKKIRTVYRN